MNNPRVSVLMSVYNGGAYLAESIESILNQSYSDFEFVIVDDGSSDCSWGILERYAEQDTRIVLLRNQPNLGVVRALNKGLEHVQTGFIARQDADDISDPERLKRQLEFLVSHPDYGLVAAIPLIVNMDGVPLGRSHYTATENEEIQELLLDYMCLCGPTIMMRRKCLEEAGYYFAEGSDASEDYDICLRLAEVTKLASLDGCLYRYRQQPESASSKNAAPQMFNKAVALEKALTRRYGVASPQEKLDTVARDYLHAAIIGYVKGSMNLANKSLREANRVQPLLLEREQPLKGLVRAYTPSETFEAAVKFTDGIFNDLFPNTKFLSEIRSRLLADLHMGQVFIGVETGDYILVDQHIWQGIRHNPSWLLNRGVAVIIGKSFVTRWRRVLSK
jgi:hypothetical protein